MVVRTPLSESQKQALQAQNRKQNFDLNSLQGLEQYAQEVAAREEEKIPTKQKALNGLAWTGKQLNATVVPVAAGFAKVVGETSAAITGQETKASKTGYFDLVKDYYQNTDSFSRAMRDAAVFDEDVKWQRYASDIVGFGADVFFDPANLLTFGTAGIAKKGLALAPELSKSSALTRGLNVISNGGYDRGSDIYKAMSKDINSFLKKNNMKGQGTQHADDILRSVAENGIITPKTMTKMKNFGVSTEVMERLAKNSKNLLDPGGLKFAQIPIIKGKKVNDFVKFTRIGQIGKLISMNKYSKQFKSLFIRGAKLPKNVANQFIKMFDGELSVSLKETEDLIEEFSNVLNTLPKEKGELLVDTINNARADVLKFGEDTAYGKQLMREKLANREIKFDDPELDSIMEELFYKENSLSEKLGNFLGIPKEEAFAFYIPNRSIDDFKKAGLLIPRDLKAGTKGVSASRKYRNLIEENKRMKDPLKLYSKVIREIGKGRAMHRIEAGIAENFGFTKDKIKQLYGLADEEVDDFAKNTLGLVLREQKNYLSDKSVLRKTIKSIEETKKSIEDIKKLKKEMDPSEYKETREALKNQLENLKKIKKTEADSKIKFSYYIDPQLNEAITSEMTRFSKSENPIKELWNGYLNMTKAWLYNLFPASHVRNITSAQFMLLNEGILFGNGAQNAFRIANKKFTRQYKNAAGELVEEPIVLTNKLGDEITLEELYDKLRNSSTMFSKGIYSDAELGSFVDSALTNPIGAAIKSGFKAMGRHDLANQAAGIIPMTQEFGRNSELILRLTGAINGWQRGMGIEGAVKATEKALFDYSKLTQFEREWMKSLIPFYTFARKNFEYWLNMMYERPGKVSANLRAMRTVKDLMESEADTEEEGLPPWVYESMHMNTGKVDKYGRPIYLTGFGLPIEEFFGNFSGTRSTMGNFTSNLFGRLAPAGKWILERQFDKDIFRDKELVELDNAEGLKEILDIAPPKVRKELADFMKLRQVGTRGVYVEGEKVGEEPRYKADPYALHTLRSLPTARVMSTMEGLLQGDINNRYLVLKYLTGIKGYAFDIEQQKYFEDLSRKEELTKWLFSIDPAFAQFQKYYLRKDQ